MNENNDLEAVKHFHLALDLLDLHSPPAGTPRHFVLMYLGIAERRLGNTAAAANHYQDGLKSAKESALRNSRDGDDRAFLGYFKAALSRDRRDAEDAEDEIRSALGLLPEDSATRWRAVLTYEELYRRFKEPAFREETLAVLKKSTADQLNDINRWPDLKDLHEDPEFKRLLSETRQVK
jgi:tetratricopeptide (TPR) repeat protein